jgi:hypothetical protein
MTVRCSQCGEQLMGAVNRCWRCGQAFSTRDQPLDAVVLEDRTDGATLPEVTPPAATGPPTAVPRQRPVPPTTAELIDARRTGQMAIGGAVGSFVLGLFGIVVALFRFEGALIALLGLVLGIWGLYSPRRNWSLVAMLLCCLAIGLGSYTGAKRLHIYIKSRQPLVDEYNPAGEPP